MNIGVIGNQNNLFHVNGVNQSAVRMNPAAGVRGQQGEQDKVTLTKQGKQQSFLSNLMKQKQSIMERRGELMASNAEKGGSMSDIQSQLDLYDEQLKNIEEQIAKASMEELEAEKKDGDGSIYDKPRTEEELQSEKLSDITELTMSLDSINVVASVKSKLDGQVDVLEAEVKSGFGNIEKKIEKIAVLESRANDLLEKTGEYISSVNHQASPAKIQESQSEADSLVPDELKGEKETAASLVLKEEEEMFAES